MYINRINSFYQPKLPKYRVRTPGFGTHTAIIPQIQQPQHVSDVAEEIFKLFTASRPYGKSNQPFINLKKDIVFWLHTIIGIEQSDLEFTASSGKNEKEPEKEIILMCPWNDPMVLETSFYLDFMLIFKLLHGPRLDYATGKVDSQDVKALIDMALRRSDQIRLIIKPSSVTYIDDARGVEQTYLLQ